MAITIGSPQAAAHRAWRLPGQGAASTVGTHRAQTAADRYSNALRSLSSTPQAPSVTQDDAVKLSQGASAPRET
ncbi:hypothetical protein UC34_19145 [Pandoraea vervacti]|uniref:Uncharacterized protein n=1 Tax=Pandoraea vervacti TaxID=656178 RepID=A0ABM5T0Z5_9BURK|nr:hypothetical protein [Pandoraea vervacti]AJP58493.1 hypothetical protein UC34_19145 [Pandoraea vervacti]